MEKEPTIIKKSNGDKGRDLINEYLRKQSLLSGEANLNISEIEKYLKEKNETTEFASTEEIEKVVNKMNESIDNLQNLK